MRSALRPATSPAAPRMPSGGSIELVSSVAAIKPPGADAGLFVMNAVQAAVVQIGRSLALELAPLRVNVLAPRVVLSGVRSAVSKCAIVPATSAMVR